MLIVYTYIYFKLCSLTKENINSHKEKLIKWEK